MKAQTALLTRIFVTLLLVCTMLPVSAKTKTATDEIKEVYQSWVQAVVTARGDAGKVTPLYSLDAILIPTLSPHLHFQNKNQLAIYFKKFTSLPSLSASTEQLQTRIYDNMAINTGLYTFQYEDDIGQMVKVPARFTFVYRHENGKWLIVDHHSSIQPPALD